MIGHANHEEKNALIPLSGKYLDIVIAAKVGIQIRTGCRIKSGMTELLHLIICPRKNLMKEKPL